MKRENSYWVFGYGSLIWRPGFEYISESNAILYGAHRCLCIFSHHHRGTKENPGLVFGLKRGGSCFGKAFQVEADKWEKTIEYLRKREQVSKVYKESIRAIKLSSGQKTYALTYLADEKHEQFAGEQNIKTQMELIRKARGKGGTNIEYVINTAIFLRKMNIRDKKLEELLRLLGE